MTPRVLPAISIDLQLQVARFHANVDLCTGILGGREGLQVDH